MQRVHVVVEGSVQGVGFRAWVVREARALGLSGQVWNRGDGAVELEAEGEAVQLARLIEAVKRGPSLAEVRDVRLVWGEGPARHVGFSVGHSRPR